MNVSSHLYTDSKPGCDARCAREGDHCKGFNLMITGQQTSSGYHCEMLSSSPLSLDQNHGVVNIHSTVFHQLETVLNITKFASVPFFKVIPTRQIILTNTGYAIS